MEAPRRSGSAEVQSNGAFSVETRLVDPVWIVHVRGEVDLTTTPELADALRMAWHDGNGTVLLDLCESGFVDSSGLHALLNAHRRLARSNRRLVVACRDGPILAVMQTTRLSQMFEIHPSIEAALAAEPA